MWILEDGALEAALKGRDVHVQISSVTKITDHSFNSLKPKTKMLKIPITPTEKGTVKVNLLSDSTVKWNYPVLPTSGICTEITFLPEPKDQSMELLMTEHFYSNPSYGQLQSN